MTVWAFRPREEVIEALEWRTDVFRAKSGETRLALRMEPRRTFNFSHTFTDYELTGALAIIRSAQGNNTLQVPDWGQSQVIASVTAGASVSIPADITYIDIGDDAVLWESSTKFEAITIVLDSNGVVVADNVVNNYTNARFMPLWDAVTADGLSYQRIGSNINQCSIALTTTENTDLASSAYTQYRDLDVVESCPKIAGGLDGNMGWPVSVFDNEQSAPYHIRQRDYPDYSFTMSWREFSNAANYELRQWLHSRKGRQKAFWLSSYSKDFQPAGSISGTTVNVYESPGFYGVGHSGVFDIEIRAAGVSYYRRVTATANGADIGSRRTIDFTIDSSVTASLSDIERISVLRCARLSADRVELAHYASGGTVIKVPCVEIPEP